MSYDMELDAPYQEPDPCKHPLRARYVDGDGIQRCGDCGMGEDDDAEEVSS